MWSALMVLGVLGALNPLRLGIALLVISRPRPRPNLFAYWVGLMTVGLPALLVPLLVLHTGLGSFERELASPHTAASVTVRHVQVGMGVFALVVAALLAARFWARRRTRQLVPAGPSDPEPPGALQRLFGPRADESSAGRLFGRLRAAWVNGSPWVALLLGLASGPTADGVLYVLAIIVPSGATFGVQVTAAIVFLLGMFAVVELMLASFLVAPASTQRTVRVVHEWAQTHRRKVLVATFAVLGVALLAQGLGGV